MQGPSDSLASDQSPTSSEVSTGSPQGGGPTEGGGASGAAGGPPPSTPDSLLESLRDAVEEGDDDRIEELWMELVPLVEENPSLLEPAIEVGGSGIPFVHG